MISAGVCGLASVVIGCRRRVRLRRLDDQRVGGSELEGRGGTRFGAGGLRIGRFGIGGFGRGGSGIGRLVGGRDRRGGVGHLLGRRHRRRDRLVIVVVARFALEQRRPQARAALLHGAVVAVAGFDVGAGQLIALHRPAVGGHMHGPLVRKNLGELIVGHAAASAGCCRCRDGRTAIPRSDRSRRRRAAAAGRRSGSARAARPE